MNRGKEITDKGFVPDIFQEQAAYETQQVESQSSPNPAQFDSPPLIKEMYIIK